MRPPVQGRGDETTWEGTVPKLSELADLARRRSGANFIKPGTDISSVEQLDLIGVTLQVRTADGPVEVPALTMFFDKIGMTLRKADHTRVVTIPWANLVSATAEPQPGAELGAATLVDLELETDRKRHRFRVPVAEPLALGRSLDVMASRYGSGSLMVDKSAKRGRR